QASVPLLGGWPVLRRRASVHRSDIEAAKLKAVITRHGLRTARQTRSMQGPVEEVTGAVPGEDAAGPVPAVCRGSQANHHEASGRVAEPRHRPSPVLLAGKPGGLLPGHTLAPLDESRAGPTDHDVPAERAQVSDGRRPLIRQAPQDSSNTGRR